MQITAVSDTMKNCYNQNKVLINNELKLTFISYISLTFADVLSDSLVG